MNTASTLPVHPVQAIDVHGHFGLYRNRNDLVNDWMSGDADLVLRRASAAHTEITVVSPLQALMPRGAADVLGGNEAAARLMNESDGLRQWVVIDPQLEESYVQAAAMLKHRKCVGIKIHPEEHLYPISEYGEQLFRFAAEHNAVVLTHSGEERSLPDDFIPFANQFKEVRLILAHLGCGWDNDPTHQVRAIQAARHGNVWVDTSSATSILAGLIEWGVRELGAERILYGTDTPLYFAAMQRVRIDQADISDDEKRLILRENAMALLDLGINS